MNSLIMWPMFTVADKTECGVCHNFYPKKHISRHMRNKHGADETVNCDICGSSLKNSQGLKDHMRRQHNIYQTYQWINNECNCRENKLLKTCTFYVIHFANNLQISSRVQNATCITTKVHFKGTLEISTGTIKQLNATPAGRISRMRRYWRITCGGSITRTKLPHSSYVKCQTYRTSSFYLKNQKKTFALNVWFAFVAWENADLWYVQNAL